MGLPAAPAQPSLPQQQAEKGAAEQPAAAPWPPAAAAPFPQQPAAPWGPGADDSVAFFEQAPSAQPEVLGWETGEQQEWGSEQQAAEGGAGWQQAAAPWPPSEQQAAAPWSPPEPAAAAPSQQQPAVGWAPPGDDSLAFFEQAAQAQQGEAGWPAEQQQGEGQEGAGSEPAGTFMPQPVPWQPAAPQLPLEAQQPPEPQGAGPPAAQQQKWSTAGAAPQQEQAVGALGEQGGSSAGQEVAAEPTLWAAGMEAPAASSQAAELAPEAAAPSAAAAPAGAGDAAAAPGEAPSAAGAEPAPPAAQPEGSASSGMPGAEEYSSAPAAAAPAYAFASADGEGGDGGWDIESPRVGAGCSVTACWVCIPGALALRSKAGRLCTTFGCWHSAARVGLARPVEHVACPASPCLQAAAPAAEVPAGALASEEVPESAAAPPAQQGAQEVGTCCRERSRLS